MADKKISELDLALQINNDAVFPMSQDNAGEPTTFKAGITQLGTEIAEDMTFSNLQTTSKKLVGAINELLALGSPIIIGTTAPTSSIGADGNIYVQYTAGTGGADDEVDGIYVKIDGAWCEISTGGGSGTTDYEDLSNKPQVNSVELVGNKSLDDLGIMPASLSKTVSGSIAHIEDGADNIPVKSLESEIVAVESGNGQPKSPTNPYTISGFDSGVVSVCGVNLWDEQWELGSYDNTGNKVSYSTRIRSVNKFRVQPNTTYYFHCSASNRICFYDSNMVFVKVVFDVINTTFTTPNNAYYMAFNLADEYGTTYNNDISINYPSTDTQYHAYNGNTYTFTFGQTVYGGHFDNNGNLVVTHGFYTFDGTENFGFTNNRFYYSFPTIVNYTTSQVADLICSTYPTVAYQSQPDHSVSSYATYLYFVNLDYTDIPTFKASLVGTTITFKLATPTSLTITSQDIPTLLGENNIFSNTGDVEVTYYTDNADEIVEVAKATASTPLHNYSTDEQVVGTWIDGSTIYEKTVSIGSLPNATGKSVPHNITNLLYVVSITGMAKNSSGNQLPLPYADIVDEYEVNMSVDNTNINISTGRDRTSFSGYVTLQYTKLST